MNARRRSSVIYLPDEALAYLLGLRTRSESPDSGSENIKIMETLKRDSCACMLSSGGLLTEDAGFDTVEKAQRRLSFSAGSMLRMLIACEWSW